MESLRGLSRMCPEMVPDGSGIDLKIGPVLDHDWFGLHYYIHGPTIPAFIYWTRL